MKNFHFFLSLMFFSLFGFAQTKEYNLQNYQWLTALESEGNLNWVEPRNEPYTKPLAVM